MARKTVRWHRNIRMSPQHSAASLGRRRRLIAITFAVILAVGVASAQAATIRFSAFQHAGSDALDYVVTVEDDDEAGVTPGYFRVTYRVDALRAFSTGKLTGFFFDVADPFVAENSPYDASTLGLSSEANPSGTNSCGLGFNTDQVAANGGCNTTLNLGADAGAFQDHQFDVAIAWKRNDLSGGGVGSFEVSDLGGLLKLSDWRAIGLRGQATDGPGGSAKEFQFMADNPVLVPLPGAVWLFGAALVVTGRLARRRR
jgi:hypothetical protein